MDLKRTGKYLVILIPVLVFCVYYLNKQKSSEYETLTSLIKNSVNSNCANAQVQHEYKARLNEINAMLIEMKNNYAQYSQNQVLGVAKLADTLKLVQGMVGDANTPNVHSEGDEAADIKAHMKVYDLKQPNENNFDCVKSKLIIVQTTICIHDIGRDIYVSGAIKGSGVWEDGLVQVFMKMLSSDKDLQVFDIGAQLGQYSLYAAKLGRKCISVEPFYDSYIRLHKSIQIEKLEDRFILVTNGMSDKRGEFKRLQLVAANVGGQTLLTDQNEYSGRTNEPDIKNNKYIIETILMDDLVEVVPKDFTKAIMKIDIEGYEVKAFKKASKLFERVDIKAIYMEWMGKTDATHFKATDILEFLEFFYSRNYEVRHPHNLQVLPRDQWQLWPGDIVFVKKDFNF